MMQLFKMIGVSIGRVSYLFLLVLNTILFAIFLPIWSGLDTFPWGGEETKGSACFASLDAYYMCCYQNLILIALSVIVSLLVCKKYPKISFVLMMLPIVMLVVRFFI